MIQYIYLTYFKSRINEHYLGGKMGKNWDFVFQKFFASEVVILLSENYYLKHFSFHRFWKKQDRRYSDSEARNG